VLEYIKQRLGIGKIYSKGKTGCRYEVVSLKEIAILIDKLSKYPMPLNTTKLMNFLDFKRAFELYTNDLKSAKVLEQIADIQEGINNKRVDYTMPDYYKPRITPY